MVDLVFEPWAKPIAAPVIDYPTLMAFIEDHGLLDLAADENTPIGRFVGQVEGMVKPETYDPDLCDDDPANYYQDADLLGEFAGRFCYRAWGKGRSTEDYIANVIRERHGSVLAHTNVSFIITGVSRALTHELIRHHVGTNPSQESQRYVTAEGGEIEIVGYRATRAVVPPLLLSFAKGQESCTNFEKLLAHDLITEFRDDFVRQIEVYNKWQGRMKGWSQGAQSSATMAKKRANEAARAMLPNATETRLVWTMNLRAARNIIEQRGNIHADLEIRRLAVALARELKVVAPISFADTTIFIDEDGFESVKNEYVKV
jgi:thymidylate synthase (FAD)